MQIQLLDLFEQKASFDNFIAINNEIVVAPLQNFSSQFTHIVGTNLSGKTHLLKAWTNLAISNNETSIYLDVTNLDKNTILLRNLITHYKFIALDNIDNLDIAYQIELFDLFNSIKLNNLNNFLLTSSKNNLENNLTMREDLKTRILSGLNLYLKALSEDELTQLLDIHAKKEGIKINTTELAYLVNHYTRNTGTLIQALQKIANSALLQNRNITIPLIKEVISNIE